MGVKFNWTGLFFILALIPALKAFGLLVDQVVVLVGAIIFGIGIFLMWNDK